MQGSAGQSFGSFLVKGMHVNVVGEANDYVGKGMAGGSISIVPPPGTVFAPEDASLVGNTCLYGATGGELFVNGRAGQPPAPCPPASMSAPGHRCAAFVVVDTMDRG